MVSDRALAHVFGLQPRAVALYGDIIRWFSAMIACLACVALAGVYARTIEDTIEVRHLQDFGTFYEAARVSRTGGDIYAGPGMPGSRVARNLNPPHFHALLVPLTWLGPTRAFGVWLAASALALAGSLVMICRHLRLGGWSVAHVVVAAWASAAMLATLLSGQVGPLLLLPFTMAWLRGRQGREAEAGIWMGVCASLKPFLLLFAVYFVVVRRMRAAGTALVTLVGIFVAGIAWYGLGAYVSWGYELASVTWAEHHLNASVLGVLERTLSRSEWPQIPLADWPSLVAPLWIAVAGVVGIATLWRIRGFSANRQFLLVTVAALLLSPLGWVYYFWFLAPSLVATLWSEAADWGGPPVALLCVGLAGLFVPPPVALLALTLGDGLGTATLGSVYGWALFALWLAAMTGTARPLQTVLRDELA